MLKHTPQYSPHLLWALFTMLLIPSTMVVMTSSTSVISWDLMTITSLPISMDIIFDQKSVILALTVLFISANVFTFSSNYMKHDPYKNRFTLILASFVLSMLLLIFSTNITTLLLGWDGLGISSFILVMFYQNPKSLAAAILTVMTNRMGDAFIMIAIMLAAYQNQLNIMLMTPHNPLVWLILLASTTKSAQIPFVSWLPAAMAAPTPVSALVHSSTLVTAGIYLMIRLSPCFSMTSHPPKYLLIISSLTILTASLAATVENDLKKIIALSTLSQLGVMMMSLAFKIPTFTFFHLITHALFKALMFLCAGTIIMINNHTQDLRATTNILTQAPLPCSALVLSAMALSGFPFLAGFYSKDIIIEMMLMNPIDIAPLTTLIIATTLTSAYATRLLICLFTGQSPPYTLNKLNLKSTTFSSPLAMLMMGAITMGSMMNWLMIQPMPHPTLTYHEKLTPLVISMLGLAVMSSFIYMPNFSPHLSTMWFITPTFTYAMKYPLMMSDITNNLMEKGWAETLGPMTMKTTTSQMAQLIKKTEMILLPNQLILGMTLFCFMAMFSMNSFK